MARVPTPEDPMRRSLTPRQALALAAFATLGLMAQPAPINPPPASPTASCVFFVKPGTWALGLKDALPKGEITLWEGAANGRIIGKLASAGSQALIDPDPARPGMYYTLTVSGMAKTGSPSSCVLQVWDKSTDSKMLNSHIDFLATFSSDRTFFSKLEPSASTSSPGATAYNAYGRLADAAWLKAGSFYFLTGNLADATSKP